MPDPIADLQYEAAGRAALVRVWARSPGSRLSLRDGLGPHVQRRQWWHCWALEGGAVVRMTAGTSTAPAWRTVVELASRARDWCAHGVTWCESRTPTGLPRRGVAWVLDAGVWQRLDAERREVRRVR